MLIEYSHNNSGGRRWVKLDDWLKLEAAGWRIHWGGKYFCHSDFSLQKRPAGAPEPCPDDRSCNGHVKFKSAEEAKAGGGSWLGELAWHADVERETPADAMREFEKLTGQKVSDEGCNCCGPPHGFSWRGGNGKHGYASGDGCLPYLFPDKQIPGSIRDALEESSEQPPAGPQP